MGNQQATGEQKKLVIVGAGFGGICVAKALNKNKAFHITVIDRKNYFENNTASVRFLVTPTFHDTQVKSLSEVIGVTNVRFVNGVLEKIDQKQVIAKNPTNNEIITVDYDYLVLATGSNYRLFKSPYSGVEERKSEIKEAGTKIENAKHILIVGGRTVGIEVLGEILDRYPDKKITVVHSGDRILDEYSTAAALKVTARLSSKKDIQFILKDKLIRPQSENETTYKTESGKVIENVDYVIWSTGYSINTSYLKGSFLESVLNERSLIKVEPTLQIQGQKNIFALGDIIDTKAAKLAYNAKEQSKIVAKNLVLLVSGKNNLITYRAEKAAQAGVVVTFGNSYGLFSRNPQSVSGGKIPAILKNSFWNSFLSSY